MNQGTTSVLISLSLSLSLSSSNNWGYSCTASATCLKQTIMPSPPPYLYYCAINQYNKMFGLQALHNTINSCAWLLLSINNITKALLSTALSPVPKLHIPQVLNPLIIESNHPYEHNLDVYFPVKMKGAKKLSIAFDKNTSTESGCDFVRLYTDSSRSQTISNADQLSGGKNGSSANWPGLDDHPPLIYDGDSFEIYFHTDGSLNSWGWKMIITPIEVDNTESESDEEFLKIEPDEAYKSCCYLKELITSADIDIKDTSDYQFDTEQPPLKHPSYINIKNYKSDEVMSGSDAMQEVVVNTGNTSWPRGLRVQKNIQLPIRKEPSPESSVVRIINATETDELLAQRECDDWYLVSHVNGEPIEGWVKRRDKDTEYLVRDRYY